MNTQELFDKVATHLLKQNAQAVNSNGACRYRGDNGMMCAVGCLIADKYYSATFEGIGVMSSSKVRMAVEDSIGAPLSPTQQALLRSLQILHDNKKPKDWFTGLVRLAASYNLNTKALPACLTTS